MIIERWDVFILVVKLYVMHFKVYEVEVLQTEISCFWLSIPHRVDGLQLMYTLSLEALLVEHSDSVAFKKDMITASLKSNSFKICIIEHVQLIDQVIEDSYTSWLLPNHLLAYVDIHSTIPIRALLVSVLQACSHHWLSKYCK